MTELRSELQDERHSEPQVEQHSELNGEQDSRLQGGLQGKSEPHSVKRIAYCGLFTALAVIMGYVESFMEFPLFPGVKLGLANSVIIFVLLSYGFKYAFYVSMVRILIVTMLFGNLQLAMFSFAGALLSIIVMWLIMRTGIFSTVGMSIAGGVAHNFGQIIVAMIMFETVGVIYYFPILIVSGLAAGLVVGLAAGLVHKRIAGHLK